MHPTVSIDRPLEQQGRAVLLQYAFVNFGYLVNKRYRTLDPNEIVAPFKLRRKTLQTIVIRE